MTTEPEHRRFRRHPCEVTADRLAEHMERWPKAFSDADCDKVAEIRYVLERIAEGLEPDL